MNYLIAALCFLLSQVAIGSSVEWTQSELRVIESLSITRLPRLPASPSNRYADNKLAQALGKQLFFDTRFSGNKKLSCASCHQPDKFFTDGLPRAVGVNATGRNTTSVVGSGWQRWFYWDGRKDSLWSQALIPFEAPDEMGSSRVAVIQKVMGDKGYSQQYRQIFGRFPAVLHKAELPEDAGPLGNPTFQDHWHRLPKQIKQAVNSVYVNLGKSLAAYQRTLVYKPTKFDRYVEQLKTGNKTDKPILDNEEVSGLRLFINDERSQCLQCHNTALLSNRGFHNVGSGNFSGERLDFGRVFGLQAVLLDEFNCRGSYSDARPDQCSALKFLNKSAHIPLQGAFKTPPLRNVSQTAPCFHDGRFGTLKEVIEFYNNPPVSNGEHELLPMDLNESEIDQLVRFLETLADS